LLDRIVTPQEDDRDRAGGVLSSAGRGESPGHQPRHRKPDQLGRQVVEPLCTPLRVAELNDHVLALDVAKVAEILSECL